MSRWRGPPGRPTSCSIPVTGHGFDNLITQRATHTRNPINHATTPTKHPTAAHHCQQRTAHPPGHPCTPRTTNRSGQHLCRKRPRPPPTENPTPHRPRTNRHRRTPQASPSHDSRQPAGADLQKFDNHQTIGNILSDNPLLLGHGAIAVVGEDAYHTTNESGIRRTRQHPGKPQRNQSPYCLDEPTTGQRPTWWSDNHHPLNLRAITAIHRPTARQTQTPTTPSPAPPTSATPHPREQPPGPRALPTPAYQQCTTPTAFLRAKRDRSGIDESLARFDGAEYPPRPRT